MNIEHAMRLGTLVVVLALGCGGGGGGKGDTVEPVSATPTPTPAEQTPPPEPIADDGMLSNQEPPGEDPAPDPCAVAESGRWMNIGVAECDMPFTKYMQCVRDTVPDGPGREAAVDALRQAADAWRDMASDPQTRQALVEACVMMESAWRQAADAMGCTW